MAYTPRHVHLVGSIGLPSGADVFRTCGRMLGRRLQRIPDGEPGGRPFDGLKLPPGTELFLGVVHARDGIEGLSARIAAASRHVPSFGIATECGMARARTPSVVEGLLELHAAGSSEPAV